jgi:hypothetical protein
VSSTDGPYFEVNVNGLTQQQASDFRQELSEVINRHPEIELEVLAQGSGADLAFYKRKLAEVDAYLLTFPEKI